MAFTFAEGIAVLTAKADGFLAGVNKVTEETKKTEKAVATSVGNMDRIFRTLGSAILGYFSFTAIIRGISSVTREAGTAEIVERKLASALKTTSNATDEQVNSLIELANTIQKTTTYGDEEIKNASALLARYKLNTEQIAKLIPNIVDMSAAMTAAGQSGGDLQGITLAIARAAAGASGALSRYGVTLSDAEKNLFDMGTQSQKVEILTKALNDRFAGAAEAMGGTYLGKVTQLENAFGDMKESIGNLLLPTGAKLITWIKEQVDWVEKLASLWRDTTTSQSMYGITQALDGLNEKLAQQKTTLDSLENYKKKLEDVKKLPDDADFFPYKTKQENIDSLTSGIEKIEDRLKSGQVEIDTYNSKVKQLQEQITVLGEESKASPYSNENIESLEEWNKLMEESVNTYGKMPPQIDATMKSLTDMFETLSSGKDLNSNQIRSLEDIVLGLESLKKIYPEYSTTLDISSGAIFHYIDYLEQYKSQLKEITQLQILATTGVFVPIMPRESMETRTFRDSEYIRELPDSGGIQAWVDETGNIITEGFGKFKKKTYTYLQDISDFGISVFNNLTSGIGNAFGQWLSGAESFGEAMKGMFKSVAISFASMIAEMMAKWALLAIISTATGGTGGVFFSGLFSGMSKGGYADIGPGSLPDIPHAQHGLITKGNYMQDVIPIMARSDEIIAPISYMRNLFGNMVEKFFTQGSMPSFNLRGGSSSVQIIVNNPTNTQDLIRQIEQNPKIILNAINKTRYRYGGF